MFHIPLSRQVDIMFKEIYHELSFLSSGTIFLHIRNNVIGKFGVRHDPIRSRNGTIENIRGGLSEHQIYSLRKMAIQSLKQKAGWTHGEIQFDFALKNETLMASVQFESNYNMSNLIQRPDDE